MCNILDNLVREEAVIHIYTSCDAGVIVLNYMLMSIMELG